MGSVQDQMRFASFIFPVHEAGLVYLTRSVLALDAQTNSDFDVIIALDGPKSNMDHLMEKANNAIKPTERPFRCTLVPSYRTAGNERAGHRNHARNAGCRASSSEYIWVLDCDRIADPNAVDHLKYVVKRSAKPLIASPCFGKPICSSEKWVKKTRNLSGEKLLTLIRQHKMRDDPPSGKLWEYREGSPRIKYYPTLVEGQPAFPRKLWEALGGYDERYLKWGGNKIEFCRRLRTLDTDENLVKVCLLVSCKFTNQPHEKDPSFFDPSSRELNTAMFNRLKKDLEQRAPWWLDQVKAVKSRFKDFEEPQKS